MLGSVFNRNQGASGVTCLLKSFKISGKTIGFSEFQGPGPPAAELGSPGDIYIDSTEGEHALYARYPNEWKEWRGMHTSPISHPDIPSRVLGIMVNSSSISWFSKGNAPESSVSNPSNVIATILAGREVKKRKRGSTNDAMESAKRMRTTLSQSPGSSTNAAASTSTSSTVTELSLPTRFFSDSNIYIPSYQPMIDPSPKTMPPPVDDRRAPMLARQDDVVLSHKSTDSYHPWPTNEMNLPLSLTRRPPDTPMKLDLRSFSKRRSASGTNKMKISPIKPPPVIPSPDGMVLSFTESNLASSNQNDSQGQHRIFPSPSQAPNTTDHVTAQSGSALPRFAIEPPTVLALSGTGETFVIDVAAVLTELIRLREENVELAKTKRDNALLVKLLASHPSTAPPDHHVADAILPTDLHDQTQTPMDIPEQGENADGHRLSPPRDDNGEQISGEDTLGEPSPSMVEDSPTEERDSFKGQDHCRLSSPTTVGFDESRESDQVDELEESESETIDNKVANGEKNPASPHLSIPMRGDDDDSGNETIQGREVDLPPYSPSDLRNIDAEDAFEMGSPPPVDAPIGVDLSNLNSDDPTEDANNFSNPSDQHNYSSPEPNVLVVKQEVVSPPSVRKTHPPFFPADREIIDLTLDDDDDNSVRDDPELRSTNLEPSTPNSLFSSPTITLPNILDQPLKSPSPDTRDIFDEIDAEWPSPPVKSQNLDVEKDDTTTQTSIEQNSSTKKSSAHAFNDPEKSPLLSNNDQSHGLNIEAPPSNAPTRHNIPRPESPTMSQDIEVKEESALLEGGLLEDANWLTTAHLQVIFDQKCVPNAFLCRLCLATEPTKIFKRGSGTSRFELKKHCADEHWDACETLRNLEHDQLLHIFDNLS